MKVRNQPRQGGSQASRVWEVGAMALIGLSLAAAAAATDHDLMPAPAQLEWGTGELVVTESFRVTSAGVADDRIDSAMRRTRGRLESLLGRSLEPAGEPVLTLVAAAPGLPVQSPAEDESYRLEVTPQGARLEAPSPLGILHGLETFLQLASRKGEGLVVPSVTIEDRPRFPWRGLLLDPSRRFQPLEVLKRTLDGMAAVKLNVFHFHLSEDQGFRIESRLFPRLHELGSDGLYFTQDQVRELIAYARDRGIRVVPEFDVPGHSTSWLVGHPELGSVPGPFSLVRRWGIFDNNLNPSNEEVYALLDGFLGEMAALFPDPYLHIGGDEVTPRQWNQNPGILEFMFLNDLRTARDLQAHFNRRVSTILERHGKRMMGWDEILHPDLPGDIVVHSWRGPAALAEAARHGYDGVLSNGYYLDHMLPASSHYAVDPLPADSKLTAEQRRHVLGGEACMWGEFVTPETIDSRIWPRAAAIAERLWSPAEVRDEEDMYRRLAVQSRRLTALGLTHDTHYAVMLKRLTGGEPIEPLRVLADLVQPVKLYARGQMRAYTSDLRLERLVDAARPESTAARSFRSSLDRCLRQSVEDRVDSELRTTLTGWRDNHAALDPILAASPLAAEARTLSRDLSGIAATGLEALDHLRARKAPPTAWVEAAKRSLDRAGQPWAEVELAVVPSLRKLVLGAERVEDLARLSPEEWEAELEAAAGKASGSRPSSH